MTTDFCLCSSATKIKGQSDKKEKRTLEPEMLDDSRDDDKKGSERIRVIQYQTICRRSGMQTDPWPLIGRRLLSYDPLTPSSCLRKPLPDKSPLTKEENGGKTS